MEKKLGGENPGLVWCNSAITKPVDLSPQVFCDWYRDVHVPDVLETGAITNASRYESMDPNEERPYLTLYYATNTQDLEEKLQAVPLHNEILPGSHNALDYAFFDTRFYKLTQLYEPEQPKPGQPDLVLSAEMTPEDEQDFEDWYRQEHLQLGSKATGWRRTERYQLIKAFRNSEAPKYLTLFYLDGEAMPDDLSKAGETDWSQRMMASFKQIRITVHKKSSHHVASKL